MTNAANPSRSELIEMLANMTELTRLKYGNLDADVWGLIERASAMVEAGRKTEGDAAQSPCATARGFHSHLLGDLPINHEGLVQYLSDMSKLDGFEESAKTMGGEANLRELVELARLEDQRDILIADRTQAGALRAHEELLRARKEATYTTKLKEGRYVVTLSKVLGHGYFERDDGEMGGGLWFDHTKEGGLELRDYDGVFDCPQNVARALSLEGVDISYLNDDLDEVTAPPAAQSATGPHA
jgi:hypothetical protein